MIVGTPSNLSGNFTLDVIGSSGNITRRAETTLMVTSITPPPNGLAVTPASGSASSGTFNFSATDAGGQASNITWMEMLFNGSLSGVRGCYLHYDQGLQKLYLRDDTNPSWVGSAPVPMGSAQLANSQCTVTAASSATAGGQLTLTLTISFQSLFVGTQNVYEIASNPGNVNSNWDLVGVWNVPVPAGALPSGWMNNAIGINPANGSSSYSGGTFTVSATGGSVGGTGDGLEFAYTPVVGNATIVAQMATSIPSNYPNAYRGVMLRSGPTPTAAMVFVGTQNGNAVMISRTDNGLNAGPPVVGPAVTPPYWFKLLRVGSGITASISPDGMTWTQLGTTQTLNVATGSTMYAGMQVGSNDCCIGAAATFDNVTVTTP